MAMRKANDGRPQISQVTPEAAIAGGEIQIRGRGFSRGDRPRVTIGEVPAPVVVGSDTFVIVRVPEEAAVGRLVVDNGARESTSWTCDIGVRIADGLHPVANPAVDRFGTVFTTFSGSRGQKTPVSVYRIDPKDGPAPFLSDLMNATGLAVDRDGLLYVSSRHDGIVYQVSPSGEMSVYVEGMGIATGLAFDPEENLYVGDRSGTVFKISRSRQIYVYATLEPSIAAYHLAFGPDGQLYMTGPTTSSYDSVYRVSSKGEVEIFYRGLGRPQGIAFDAEASLYVAASLAGRRGIVRINAQKEAELYASGPGIVGLAFSPTRAVFVATNNAIYRLDAGLEGWHTS